MLVYGLQAVLVLASSMDRGARMEREDESGTYAVVVNDEQQYAIWPVIRDLPVGWKESGYRGSRSDCLAHIEMVWTDMRPLSVRRSAAQAGLTDATTATRR